MMSCDGYFCKLLTRGFPNYVTFCGVGVDVLEGGSNKPISWSVESVCFLAPLWEDRKNIHLVRKDRFISNSHSNWQACDENDIK